MSRTRRIYNKMRKDMHRGKWYGEMGQFYHPYIEWCCGHCKHCKDVMKSRREKLERQREARWIIENEIDSELLSSYEPLYS